MADSYGNYFLPLMARIARSVFAFVPKWRFEVIASNVCFDDFSTFHNLLTYHVRQ